MMETKSFRPKTLLVYFLVTFGFSWALWGPEALVAQGILPQDVQTNFGWLFSYAAWGPLLGAFAAAWYELRLDGVKDLLRRAISLRHGAVWYLLALVLFPLLIGGSLWLATLGGETLPVNTMLEETVNGIMANGAPQVVAYVMALVVGAFFIFFLGGPLQEEFGWRGLLLDRLQTRFSPLWSSVITGLSWGLWHLPLFFISRQEMYYQRPLWGLLLSTVLVSIIMTGVFNRTSGSIFIALVLHTSFNWSHYAFPTLKSDTASLILFGVLGLASAIFIWRQRMWEKT
jgi:membrane protease YdiL (CAAX protease family)